MLKIAIQDHLAFIKKNKVLFFLIAVGLFSVSFLSLLLLDTIRYNFLSDISYEGKHGFTYVYESPVSGKALYKELNKSDLSICAVYFASEQSHINDPETTDSLLKSGNFVYNSGKSTEIDNLGIVGYADSPFNVRAQSVFQGRFFNFTDSGKMNAVINDGFSYLEKDGYISAEGHSFKIIGKTSATRGRYLYDKCNILIPLKTFAKLDVNVKVVQINFRIPPSREYLNKMTNILESFGENENTNEDIGFFTFSIILSMIPASLLQIVAMVFVVLTMVLLFKCWIKSQQGVYRIYSICGVSDKQVLILRLMQLFFMFVPLFTLASVSYISLALSNYKTFVYNILPHTFVFNFVLLISILVVMVFVQNRENTGYNSLNHI